MASDMSTCVIKVLKIKEGLETAWEQSYKPFY